MSILHYYKNGNYSVTLFSDGTKVRRTDDNKFIPAFAENCDVKITDRCDGGCPMCYEGCTSEGKHGDILNDKFINSLHVGTELALNGNDLTHPHLVSFLKRIKEKGVIANLTVNQMHFERHYSMLKALTDNKLIWGLGVSLREPTHYFIEHLKGISNAVIHTIVGVVTEQDILKLSDQNLKILILGYKPTGRGKEYADNNIDSILKNTLWLHNHLADLTDKFSCVSFDNLAIKQLDVKRIMSEDKWERFYMGDDGMFTFYIDLVNKTFSKNSIIAKEKSIPINDMTIDEMFEVVRNTNWE